MSLRVVTLALVAGILLALLAAVDASFQLIVLHGFARVEDTQARRNVARVVNALDDDLARLDGTTRDWSAWDDTYAFIQDHNTAYVESNLANDTPLISNKLNTMLFVDQAGGIVFEKAYDLEDHRKADVPAGLRARLTPGGTLLAHPDPRGSTLGLVVLPEGVMLVASQAILTSDNNGPPRGTLIFGRFLDAAELQRLEQRTAVSLSLRPLQDDVMPADFAAALPQLSDQAPVAIRPLDSSTIAGYTILKDVAGQPALVLRVAIPREVYAEGQSTIVYSLAALALAGLLFGAAILVLLERLVLARLARLGAAADRVASSGDLSLRVGMPGRDELSRLAGAINRMLQSLESAQQQRQQAEQALEHLALHDGLTGLANRTLLRDRLEHALAMGRRGGVPFALLLLDLDRFKAVNDTLGHQAGDRLLVEVARRLRGAIRAADTVARLGGDEFAALLTPADAAGSVVAATRVRGLLEAPIALREQVVTVGASVGIALYPAHGDDPETLLRHADIAMYAAKAGGGGHALYDSTQEHAPGRLALEAALRAAIDREQLVLHFQPRVALADGQVRGVEALVRWKHPERGMVPPEEFIPLAEQTGLIAPLTRWVLDAALRQARAWHADGLTLPVAVNLSMRNLHDPALPDTIAGQLAMAGVPPASLLLEITESAAMADPLRTVEALSRLDAMGVHSSIDDFGTGYSSLLYLKRLPVRQIKIDRSFVQDMATDENSLAIVRATVDLGHNLGLEVVAEGVEDQATWRLLRDLGCDAAQGFFVSRPLPAAELIAWLGSARGGASSSVDAA